MRGPMVNGILGQDDMYRRGLPAPKFSMALPAQLRDVFDDCRSVDPFALVANEIRSIGDSIAEVVGSDHPVLERIAQYFFQVQGMLFAFIVLLCVVIVVVLFVSLSLITTTCGPFIVPQGLFQ